MTFHKDFKIKKIKEFLAKNREEEVVFSRDNSIEVFYKDGEIKRQEIENFPLSVPFLPPCGSFDKGRYRISVKEVYMESGVKREKTLIDSVHSI